MFPILIVIEKGCVYLEKRPFFVSSLNDAKLLKDDKFLNGLSVSITNGLGRALY